MSILKFKKVNCKNCYKCVRYCPVKAIEVKNHQAQIIERDCILCGNCTVVCPQNAKEDVNDVPKIKALIRDGNTVIATIAPSYVAEYNGVTIDEMEIALKKLGFEHTFETAEGAFLVKTQYENLIKNKWNTVIISSCCPTVVSYIEKHYPEALPYLSPVISPMEANARTIKEKYKDAKVVFIGPCIAKKGECEESSSSTDYAITFEELKNWLLESNVNVVTNSKKKTAKYKSRLFPISGGIINTMKKDSSYSYIAVDGLNNCINALHEIVDGKLTDCFVEMSACNGSCIGGPHFKKYNNNLISSRVQVEKSALEYKDDKVISKDFTSDNKIKVDLVAERNDKKIEYAMPSQKQIAGILKKMGKNSEDDELNCGSCGYATCRDKAIAVYFGKAEISMCLPYMKERAESFSDKIINVTPNSIIAVDMDLKVQQINKAACTIFGIINEEDIIGEPVSRILDEYDFVNMITNGITSFKKKTFLVEYNVYLEQTYLYDKANSIIICIMQDITELKKRKNELKEEKMRAVNMADEIVEKQLRIVHEIASLLGETAAETKVVVEDLKDTIMIDE